MTTEPIDPKPVTLQSQRQAPQPPTLGRPTGELEGPFRADLGSKASFGNAGYPPYKG